MTKHLPAASEVTTAGERDVDAQKRPVHIELRHEGQKRNCNFCSPCKRKLACHYADQTREAEK